MNRDFPVTVAAEDGPVWLPVCGRFGRKVYPDRFDFPFPGNVRPLFMAFHIAEPEFLDEESLAYLKRFAPIGCRDLFTARLLRGAGVPAFREVAARFESIAQPVLAAVLEGKGEAETYALWREAVAPAMARTDAMIAERNAKHPLPEVSLNDLGLDRIPAQSFGEARKAGGDPVHLLFSFDDNLADFFPATFEGVWRYATRPLVVHVFGRGLDAGMFEGWAGQFPGVRFVWRDCSGVAFPDTLNLQTYTTVSTVDRLFAPALLADVEKVVYLDMDILVRKDIVDLFDIDFDDAPLAAHDNLNDVGARFPYLESLESSESPTTKRAAFRDAFFSGGATVFKTFNAGVIVMNLAKMRDERAVEKTLALVLECGVHDQTALNLYARDRWKPLAKAWNHESRLLGGDPAIVHFTGRIKPWSANVPLPFQKEWRENMIRAQARMRQSASGSPQ